MKVKKGQIDVVFISKRLKLRRLVSFLGNCIFDPSAASHHWLHAGMNVGRIQGGAGGEECKALMLEARGGGVWGF